MCRILAITNFDYSLHKHLIDGFLNMAVSGKIPPKNSPGHFDGWGVGYYKNRKSILQKSGKSIISEKNMFINLIKNIKKTKFLILHLRKSSWPATNLKRNSHPFSLGNIIFCHNGTVYDYKKLKINHKIFNKKALDSEIYFHFFMNYRLDGTDIEKAFENCTASIKNNNNYSSLTTVFSDGKTLYAYRDFTIRPWYYTLYTAKENNSVFISSEPIKTKAKWNLLKKGKIFSTR